jgi:hypothetical protein
VSAPRASIVHRMPGRLRLRIHEKRDDTSYFAELDAALRRIDGVDDVVVNPATSSALLHLDTALEGGASEAVLRAGEALGLFEIAEEPPRGTPLAHLYERVLEADRRLAERTEGRWDLATLGFYALLGGSAVQLVRGKFMPAGATLMIQALGLVLKQAERRR